MNKDVFNKQTENENNWSFYLHTRNFFTINRLLYIHTSIIARYLDYLVMHIRNKQKIIAIFYKKKNRKQTNEFFFMSIVICRVVFEEFNESI